MEPDGPHIRPTVLKIGGMEAGKYGPTTELIRRVGKEGPLTAIISAPNFPNLRTTDTLIEASKLLSGGDAEGSIVLLEQIKSRVLWEVHKVADPRMYEQIFRSFTNEFARYYKQMRIFAKMRQNGSRGMTELPTETNDYRAIILGKSENISIPFLELGEDISAIIYSILTDTDAVGHRGGKNGDAMLLDHKVSSGTRIVSGAVGLNGTTLLEGYGRGYTDANAGLLATKNSARLLIHKEHPLYSADPQIVGDRAVYLPSIGLTTLRESLHPLIRAQFLNASTLSHGLPHSIQIGQIGTPHVTDVEFRGINLDHLPPILHLGQRVTPSKSRGSYPIGQHHSVIPDPDGREAVVSIMFHSRKQADSCMSSLENGRLFGGLMGIHRGRIIRILVPHNYGASAVQGLHQMICERR